MKNKEENKKTDNDSKIINKSEAKGERAINYYNTYVTLLKGIEDAETKSIGDFNLLINKKTDSEINRILPEKIEEYQQKMQLIVDKSDQERNTYIQKLKTAKEKNLDLNFQIGRMKIEQSKLENQNLNAENSIQTLEHKYKTFEKLEKLFETLIEEMDTDKQKTKEEIQKQIITDIKLRREQEKENDIELKKINKQIIELKSSKKEFEISKKMEIEELSSKLNSLDKENKKLEDNYLEEIKRLNTSIYEMREYKNINLRYHNIFSQFYNIFYVKFNLEQGLEFDNDKYDIHIQKNDYKAKISNEDELMRYIRLMIKTTSDDSSGEKLRNAVAFCNMMLRNDDDNSTINKDRKSNYKSVQSSQLFLHNEKAKSIINEVYKPFNVFGNIKILLNKNMEKKKLLLQQEKNYKEREIIDEKVIIQLQKDINILKDKYLLLGKKYGSLFNKKLTHSSNKSKKFNTENNSRNFSNKKDNNLLEKNKNNNKLSKRRSSIRFGEKYLNTFTDDEIHHYIKDKVNIRSIDDITFNYKNKFNKVDKKYKKNILEDLWFMNKNIMKNKSEVIKGDQNDENKKIVLEMPPPTEDQKDSWAQFIDHTNRLFLFKNRNMDNYSKKELTPLEKLDHKIKEIEKIKMHKKIIDKKSKATIPDKLISKIDAICTNFNNEVTNYQ